MFQRVEVVVPNAIILQAVRNALLDLMDMLVMELVKVWSMESNRVFHIGQGYPHIGVCSILLSYYNNHS